MNVDTRLREAGKAVRDARRGEFTVQPPTARRSRLSGPTVAVATAVLVVAAIGVPAFLTGSDPSQPAGTAHTRNAPAASQPNDQATLATEPDDFPYLGLDLPDSVVSAAYDIEDEVSGEKIGTHTEYLQTWTDDNGDDGGRVIELRVQPSEHDYKRFEDLVAAAETSRTVQTAGREVTVYAVADEATDECCYDLGVLHWIEQPGIEVIIIPWGLNEEEAIELLDRIHPLEANEWNDLTGVHISDTPTTTIADSSMTTSPDSNS